MPRAFLIGWAGGLVDLAATRLRVLLEVLQAEGIEPAAELLAIHPCTRPYEEWLGVMVRAVRGGEPGSLPPRLMVRAAARYREETRRAGPAWTPGALDFVRAASTAGLDLGLVATVPRRELDDALASGGIDSCFRVVVSAEDVERGVPGSTPYLVAMMQLNSRPPLPERLIHPHEVLAIEGSDEGLRAAVAAGLSTIALGSVASSSIEPDRRVDSFEALEPSSLRSG